jgi:hypothetical protein
LRWTALIYAFFDVFAQRQSFFCVVALSIPVLLECPPQLAMKVVAGGEIEFPFWPKADQN